MAVIDGERGMSFEEKSVWAQLVALVVAASACAAIAVSFWRSEHIADVAAYAALLVGALVLQAVVLGAGSLVVALTGRHEPPDERDRLIRWRATARSGWVLVTGVLVALAGLVLEKSPLWLAVVLLASLVACQVLGCALRLVAYRRGA